LRRCAAHTPSSARKWRPVSVARRHGGSNYRPETMSRVGQSPQMRPG